MLLGPLDESIISVLFIKIKYNLPSMNHYEIAAIASISMSAPLGSALTAMVDRAGSIPPLKYYAYMALKASKLFISFFK
jgi:hypothetical protein